MTRTSTSPTGPRLAARGAAVTAGLSDPIDQARMALAWAHDTFGHELVLASSMGDEVLVHLASEVVPEVSVLFIDTGYHFAETLGTARGLAETRPVRLLIVHPARTVAEQDTDEGPDLFTRDPDRCCALRKVEPLERGLAPFRAWITGMRRADAQTRAGIEVVGWDARREMVKLNPLAAWTDEDVDTYALVNDVTLNPLRQAGYTSIGCQPCTNLPDPGNDPRSGRWSGRAKTECGLHT